MLISESRLRKIIRQEIREALSDQGKRAAGEALSGIKAQSDSIRSHLVTLKSKLDVGGNIDTAQIDAAIKKYDAGETDAQSVLDDLQGLSSDEEPAAAVTESDISEDTEKDCFERGLKTFKGKSSCIQDTKGMTADKADAYVASVLRRKGEIE